MSSNKYEQLSGLMDGDTSVSVDATLKSVEADPALRAAWQRYHLIGDSLREQLPAQIDPGFSARVASLIQHEPAILAPQRSGRRMQQFLKPAAGMAIAASVAIVALVSLQGIDTSQDLTAEPSVAATAPVQQPATQVAGTAPANTASVRTVSGGQAVIAPRYTPQSTSLQQQRLNSYLVNHNEYRASNGSIQGVTPYVRIIAHDPE
ncbi:MAG: sigma-E factor negative regulatory protein [Gammaproteobacteria bacterium]